MSKQGSNPLSMIGSAALIVLAVSAVIYLALQVERAIPLNRSAIGFDGLAQLLEDQEQPARTFSGGAELEVDRVGLRILPIYRIGFGTPFFVETQPGERRYLAAPNRNIAQWVIEGKIEAAPTLVVLPKWSDGVRLSGLAHPDFLLKNPDRSDGGQVSTDFVVRETTNSADAGEDETDTPDTPARPSDTDGENTDFVGEIKEPADGLGIDYFELPDLVLASTDVRHTETLSRTRFGDIALAAPQYMRVPDSCRPLIGDEDRALLMSCAWGGDKSAYWVLSDPDLLNNHGLHKGGNAVTALALIEALAGDGDVVIDYSTELWSRPVEDRRTLAELFRFLAPPFTWLWVAAAILFALAWWRGAVRDRPIFSIFSHGHRGARTTVITAQSRLMRNTGRDGALLRVLAHQRMLVLCDLLLGRDDRVSNRQARMLAFVERRSPELARRLAETLKEVEEVPERLSSGAAVALLTRLETAYEEARQLA